MKRFAITTLFGVALLVGGVWAADTPVQGEAEDPRAAAERFLADNAKRDSVISLPNGLQYEVIEPGRGRKPTREDTVTVHYRGILSDGTEFESSYRGGGPETLRLDVAIPGWQEALQRMPEGAYWVLYLPPELALGKHIAMAGQVLIYEINLLSVNAAEESKTDREQEEENDRPHSDQALVSVADESETQAADATQQGMQSAREQEARIVADQQERPDEEARGRLTRDEGQVAFAYLGRDPAAGKDLYPLGDRTGSPQDYAFLEKNASKGGVIILPGGLQYRILRNGTGASPRAGDTFVLDYRGRLPEEKEFTPPQPGGKPAGLRLDQLIPGWREVFLRMEEGAQWEIYVPPELDIPAEFAFSTSESLHGRTVIIQIELLSTERGP